VWLAGAAGFVFYRIVSMSLLMRLLVSQFGLAAATVRLPSFIGAAIYIV